MLVVLGMNFQNLVRREVVIGTQDRQRGLNNVVVAGMLGLIQIQIQIQTVHRLHLSDQRQDCHYVVNTRSNRNTYVWTLCGPLNPEAQ